MTQVTNMNEPIAVEEAPKLTDWSNEPTLRELKTNYEDAREVTNTHISEINSWLDFYHIRGQAKIKVPEGNSKVQPRLIRKQAEWRYPALSEPFLSSPNMFEVNPVTAEDAAAARQNRILLNNQFDTKLNKQQFIDEYVRAACDEGTAIIKVGWDNQTRMVKKQQPTYQLFRDESVQPLLQQVAEYQERDPSLYPTLPEELRVAYENSIKDGVPYRAVVSGSEEVEVEETIVNQPTLKICDYRNVVIDPSCGGDLRKAKFVVELFESSFAELKADGRYKNLDRLQVAQQDILSEPDYASPNEGVRNFNFHDKARRRLVVHEYWGFVDIDGSGQLQPIVAAWVGNVLIRMEESPFPDGKLPFVVVPYLPRKRSAYGESDGSLLIDNQKIIGAVARGMIDIMGKSANGQMGIMKGALDITNRRRFDRGENYEFNPGSDPRTAIHMHTFPEIPVSAQYMLNMQQAEAESMTGVKAFSNGISGAALGDTATGIRGALDAASKRELGILRRLSNGLIEVGRKIIAMNAVFLDDTEVIRVTNEEFVEIRRDDLYGNFDLKLTISTAEEDNAKVSDLSFMLQTMGPNMDWAINAMVLSEIAELKKMPDLARKIREYQPQPDPLAQKRAELEIMEIEARIMAERARAMHYMSGAGLQDAKVGTEQAKTRALGSQADLNDLNFVEQESGVKQERDLQRLEKQATAQGDLAVLQSYLKRQEEVMYPRTSQR